MKGLLIKDIQLLLKQKVFILILVLFAIGMLVLSDNKLSGVAYITVFLGYTSISTVSYDNLNNGNVFLFTLPFTRKEYALSKYIMGIGLGAIGWIIMNICLFIMSIVENETMHFTDVIVSTLIVLGIGSIVLQSLLIPIQLKFGATKGNLVGLLCMGILFAGLFAIFNSLSEPEVMNVILKVSNLHPFMLASLFICGTLIVLLISIYISMYIIKKREF